MGFIRENRQNLLIVKGEEILQVLQLIQMVVNGDNVCQILRISLGRVI